jgi:hypothetical protein
MKHYKAPWGTPLIVSSSLATVLCLGLAVYLDRNNLGRVALLLLAINVFAALFTIRGYTITADAILVHRLFWATRLPLAGLQSAEFSPGAMCKSMRTFGNGGLFSFTGFYRNKALGSYRAFVTDLRRTVVLRYDKRTVVISPAVPEEFVRDLAFPSPACANHNGQCTKGQKG